MPARTDQREEILAALKSFESKPLADAARRLFSTLGYESDRRIPIATPKQFRESSLIHRASSLRAKATH